MEISKNTRNQNACDVCRSRRVKCRFSDGEVCDGCRFLGVPCTANRPRRKRGPPNRIESPQLSPATTPFSPSSDSGRSSATILSHLAPSPLINTVLDDWFTHVHPLAPVLHQRHFFTRFADSSSNDAVFTGLVISVLAATAATLRRKSFTEYHPITPDRCIQLIQHHGLLPAHGPYSLDWCIAKYNLATASMAQRGLSDPLVYRMIGESVTGTSYLLSNELEEMGLLHQELLKRLWCLLEITLINADMLGQPLLGRLVLLNSPAYIPQPYADDDLYVDPSAAVPSFGQVTYVPGLTHLLSLFRAWHTCQIARLYRPPSEVLATALADIQNTLDTLPPPLRWRGGLSRPATATPGHDVQIANIFITSLYVRSNLLQQFAPSTAPEHQEEHQRIVSDLLEVLNHLPREILEANGYSLVPKIRDIGGAYLELLRVHADMAGELVVIGDQAKAKLEGLLSQLGMLDFRPF
ncbi:hypothetical protein BDW60DRAFT_227090 [Aspergillus nidulans var. acristatus]